MSVVDGGDVGRAGLSGAGAGASPLSGAGVGGGRVYYGWVMLPVATLAMIATSPAQTFGISAFNGALRESLGLSHSELTGAYMVGTFLASLPLTYVGVLMDRYGLRRVMAAVVVLLGLVCMGSSQVRGLGTLFLAFLFLRMLGQGALGLLSGNVLPFWFHRRLGTVEGIRQFGMAGAIAVVPGLNLWLIDAYGWRTAWVVLGAAVLAMMLPLMVVFRNRPRDVGQHMDGRAEAADPSDPACEDLSASFTFGQARRTRSFWIVGAITAMWAMLVTAVLFNIVPLMVSRGLSEADAARLFTGFAVSLAVMQLVGGVLADRLPLHWLLSASAAGMSAGMWMLWWIEDAALVLPLALVLGASQGLLAAGGGPLWPRYYGTAHLGRIRGSLATVMVSASSVGPFVLGVCVDWTGSYDVALLVFAAAPAPMVVLSLLATRPARPRSEEEEACEIALPPEGVA